MTMIHDSDEQALLRAARAFDPQALGEIYDRYSPALYRYAARLLEDEDQAEECVAEIFSRLLKALQAGKGPREHLQAYLYRAAHNWITDTYRCQPALPLMDDYPAGEAALPEPAAEQQIERQRVRRALFQLTPDQRQVVVLRFLEGWDQEKVAAALQKPLGAVKSLQHRALAALQRSLNPEKEGLYDR